MILKINVLPENLQNFRTRVCNHPIHQNLLRSAIFPSYAARHFKLTRLHIAQTPCRPSLVISHLCFTKDKGQKTTSPVDVQSYLRNSLVSPLKRRTLILVIRLGLSCTEKIKNLFISK
jgi:hypothetical protein